jgi:hypothetical protein
VAGVLPLAPDGAAPGSTARPGGPEVLPAGGPTPIGPPEVAAFAGPEAAPGDGIHRAPARMPAARRKALRDFRLELKAGLSDLQLRVAACSLADASFVLDLESVDGGVRIVDAAVEAAGTASERDVACARAALRGHLIPAARAEPGRRWQLPFAVRPPS